MFEILTEWTYNNVFLSEEIVFGSGLDEQIFSTSDYLWNILFVMLIFTITD